MAIISEKNTRRYRVQFTMSRTLHQAYEASLVRARKIGVVIDFTRDFEKFFANQLEQVVKELQLLETEQSQSVAQQVVERASVCKAVSSPMSVTGQIYLEGGADHGDAHE